MKKPDRPGSVALWDVEIISPLEQAYKELSTRIPLPSLDSVLDYINNDTPITTTIVTTSYEQACCKYGKLYEGRRTAGLIIRPTVVDYVLEFKVSNQYSPDGYKLSALYVRYIRQAHLDLLEFLEKVGVDYKILDLSARIAALTSGPMR